MAELTKRSYIGQVARLGLRKLKRFGSEPPEIRERFLAFMGAITKDEAEEAAAYLEGLEGDEDAQQAAAWWREHKDQD